MDQAILTEEQELAGDQIASHFYREQASPIRASIINLLGNQAREVAAAITEITIGRLYSEQAARRQYLATAFGLAGSSREEQSKQLLDIAETDSQTSPDPSVTEQLKYYRIVSSNLIAYEVEQWQKENQLLFQALVKSSPDLIKKLSSQLSSYVATFYQNGSYTALNQITIPPAVIETLESINIAVGLNRYETIIQKSAFLVFILQLCELMNTLRTENITTEEEILQGLALGTLHFRSILIKAE